MVQHLRTVIPRKRDDAGLAHARVRGKSNPSAAKLGAQQRAAVVARRLAIADQQHQVETLDKDALDQLYTHFKARVIRFTKS